MGENLNSATGQLYFERIRAQLNEQIQAQHPMAADCQSLLSQMNGTGGIVDISPAEIGKQITKLNDDSEKHEHPLNLSPHIQCGNMWPSCYFAMTAFHARH